MSLIRRALHRKQYPLAKSRMSVACRNIADSIGGQEFNLLSDMLFMATSHFNPSHRSSSPIVGQSLSLLARHSLETSLNAHGPHHPMSSILKMVCNAIHVGGKNDEELLAALEVIQASCERMLGADHIIILETRLALMRLTSAAPIQILPMLRYWEEREGFGSFQVLICIQAVLSTQKAHRDYQGLQHTVDHVTSRLHQIEEEDSRRLYALIILEACALAYVARKQWNLAVEVFQGQLLPEMALEHGENSLMVLTSLLLLKKCLVKVGDWMQLEELEGRLHYLQQRLENGDGDDTFMTQ